MNITEHTRYQPKDTPVGQMQRKLPEIATSFGWNPQQEWIQALNHSIARGGQNLDANLLQYELSKLLDPATYVTRDGATWVVEGCYGYLVKPDPIEALSKRAQTDLGRIARGEVSIVIKARSTHVQNPDGSTWILFKECGRGDWKRATNASELVAGLVGLTVPAAKILRSVVSHGRRDDIVVERSTYSGGYRIYLTKVAHK